MKIYKTNGEAKFEIENIESEESEKIKVKITHVMPGLTDVNIFSGDITVKYPFIIGHSAIGVVSDDRPEYGLKRGTKVILNPYTVTDSAESEQEYEVKTRGVDTDGFMREFIFMDRKKIIPFPEDVNEEEAIFTERIALALEALNCNTFEKGDYVVIIGSDTLCNIIGQLALYFQLIPIMIGNNESDLQIAEKCGIYYTINETKESPIEKVREITCGRMSENTIISIKADVSSSIAFKMTQIGGKCVLLCDNNVVKRADANIGLISKRNLNVRGVSNGADEFDSAINILAQKILHLEKFIDKTVEMKDSEVLLRELRENSERYFNAVIKL